LTAIESREVFVPKTRAFRFLSSSVGMIGQQTYLVCSTTASNANLVDIL